MSACTVGGVTAGHANRAGDATLTTWLADDKRRVARRLLDRASLAILLAIGVAAGLYWATSDALPVDSDLFWRASFAESPYGATWGADRDSLYVYPPPLAQVLVLFHGVGWPIFVTAWTTAVFIAWWITTRWWTLPVLAVSALGILAFGPGHALAFPITYGLIGNPQAIVAAAIVVGFRWPAVWAFVLLTKIAPGLGLLWFVVRREWRNLAIAAGTTSAIVAVSMALAPGLWVDFLRFATTNAGTTPPVPVVAIPFVVRLPMSIALIVWGARTDRRWTVPVAAGWASLALYEWSVLVIWLAALPLLGRGGRDRDQEDRVVARPMAAPALAETTSMR